jgi:hypothetical protein
VYIYTNSKLLQEQLGANPTTWYKKNMLSKDSTFDVNESANESGTSDKTPLVSNENKDQHYPFKFPNDDHSDNILFPILLSNAMV